MNSRVRQEALLAQIAQAERLLIFSHTGPDGDAVGSALGLWWLLKGIGKEATLSFADPIPHSFHFLPGVEMIADRPFEGQELIMALDGSDATRYGATFLAAQQADVPLIVIDHHKTNTHFGTLNWVDSSFAATAQMIYQLADWAGWPISQEAALCLATGCVTDTNAFSTDHTTPELLELVADLMRQGASLATIIRQAMSLRTPSDAALWGRVLYSLQVEGGVAWAISTLADQQAVGASPREGSGLSSFLCNIVGVQIGVLFVEEAPDRVRLSFRSRPRYDVGGIALSLGGGGHTQAAGATLAMSLAEAMALVLPRARAIADGYQGAL